MGHKNSKEEEEEPEEDFIAVKEATHFKLREVIEMYGKFQESFPEGQISKENFISMYSDMFPDSDPTAFAEKMFESYDIDGNGSINFREFLCGLSVTTRGTYEERIRWTFNLYDSDGDGYVTRKEATEIITAIFKMKGRPNAAESAQEEAYHIFMSIDKNQDDKITETEFALGARNVPFIASLLLDDHDDKEEP